MKNALRISTIVWVIASFAALFFADELKPMLTYKAWLVVKILASLQILFGCIVNPIVKHVAEYRREKANRELALGLLGLLRK